MHEVALELYLDQHLLPLQVLVNGRQRDIYFNRISAYVPQEEVFVPTMSALETISFHAKLSLPHNVPKAQRKAQILRMLTIMGLFRVRYTTVCIQPPCGSPSPENVSLLSAVAIRVCCTRPDDMHGCCQAQEPLSVIDDDNQVELPSCWTLGASFVCHSVCHSVWSVAEVAQLHFSCAHVAFSDIVHSR